MANRKTFSTCCLTLSSALQWPLCFCISRNRCSHLPVRRFCSCSSVQPEPCTLGRASCSWWAFGENVSPPSEHVNWREQNKIHQKQPSLGDQSGFSTLFISMAPIDSFLCPWHFLKLAYHSSILTPLSCLLNLFFLKWLSTHSSHYRGQTSNTHSKCISVSFHTSYPTDSETT